MSSGKIGVQIKCDDICKVFIISSVIKWCSHSFLCATCPMKPLKTAVWRRYVKFSLKCFHRACFERSYFHSIAGLSSLYYFACESQLEYEMDQVWHIAASWFSSECVCVCEREKDRQIDTDSFFGGEGWGKNIECLLPSLIIECCVYF